MNQATLKALLVTLVRCKQDEGRASTAPDYCLLRSLKNRPRGSDTRPEALRPDCAQAGMSGEVALE